MTRLWPGGSSGVLTGALRLAEASIGFGRGIKALGMWLPPGSVIALCAMPWLGPRNALCKDAGIMVINDPS